jgi:hypothetical protein
MMLMDNVICQKKNKSYKKGNAPKSQTLFYIILGPLLFEVVNYLCDRFLIILLLE